MNSPAEASVEIEVPFHDVDSLRIVWHGHYLKYFEIARTALFRRCELDDRFFLERRFALVVVESRVRHTRPLRYGDVVRVTARFLEVPERIGVIYHLVDVATGTHVARGRTLLVAVDAEGNLLHPVPEDLRARIRL